MRVNLPFLLFAIVLLWFPRQWMRLGLSVWRRRKTNRAPEPWKTAEPGDPAVRFGAEFSKLRNYVDLLRATAGSVALLGGLDVAACLDAPPGATTMARAQVLALKIAILLGGLLIQTVRYERQRFLFFAPIFFVFGLSVGLCGIKGAGFAFAMTWALNAMVKNPQGFLSVYALATVAFGLFFTGLAKLSLVMTAAVFCFLPVLLSLLTQRPLVLFTRKGTRPVHERP